MKGDMVGPYLNENDIALNQVIKKWYHNDPFWRQKEKPIPPFY